MDSFTEVEKALTTGWSQNGHSISRPNTESRKVGNNTYLIRYSESEIALRLHTTDVLIFTPTEVTLNSGGWETVTTKARLNAYLPKPFKVYATKRIWYLWNYEARANVSRFYDGLRVTYDGKVLGAEDCLACNGPHSDSQF